MYGREGGELCTGRGRAGSTPLARSAVHGTGGRQKGRQCGAGPQPTNARVAHLLTSPHSNPTPQTPIRTPSTLNTAHAHMGSKVVYTYTPNHHNPNTPPTPHLVGARPPTTFFRNCEAAEPVQTTLGAHPLRCHAGARAPKCPPPRGNHPRLPRLCTLTKRKL